MDYTILINKENPLCIDFVPNDLITTEYSYIEDDIIPKISATIYPYFIKMVLSAKKEGFNIIINSAYRGAKYQQEIWDYYEEKIIKENKDNIDYFIDKEDKKQMVSKIARNYEEAKKSDNH